MGSKLPLFCAALACAAAAGAQEPPAYDLGRPDFWQKTYTAVRPYTVTYFVQISTSYRTDAESAARDFIERAGGKRLENSPNGWAVPDAAVQRLLQSLFTLGDLKQYFRNSSAPSSSEVREMEYKKKGLEKERATLAPHKEKIAGIMALVAAELNNLGATLEKYDSGRNMAVINLNIVTQGRQ